jgi:uncharacterized protein YjbI with pentapeptide repeats
MRDEGKTDRSCGGISVKIPNPHPWPGGSTVLPMINTEQEPEIWARLIDGRSLDGLGLKVRNGRFDLAGLVVKAPSRGKRISLAMADVTELESLTVVRGATWRAIDFSGSDLRQMRFFDCRFEDCVFDRCRCQDWRLWKTIVENSSFLGADLRKSALGGVINNHRNSFRHVDFTEADLRQTAYFAAEFVGCTFRNSHLKKIDFQTSSFAECSFEGELNEVLFYSRGFKGEAYPPNEMAGIDLTRAQLRFVEFRNLDLDRVSFPRDADHIILRNYPETLDRILEVFRKRNDMAAKILAASLGVLRKWAGAGQHRGILNKKDIVEIAGEEALADLMKVAGPFCE